MTVEEAIKLLQTYPPKAKMLSYDSEWNSYDDVNFQLIKLERLHSDKQSYNEADPEWPEKRLNGKKVFDAVIVNY